jgi:methylglutaconyl-CoA hydratase
MILQHRFQNKTDMHKMEYIDYQVADRVANIILNRPDKRNAFNEGLVTELKDALQAAEHDNNVKIIRIKANGQVFSAGADLAYLQKMQAYSKEQNIADTTELAALFKYIYTHPKIIVAQVEGHAIAGGCGLATLCDFSFAVPEANFGYSEVKIGFIPAIVMVFLLRKIGEGKAKELLLTGKLLNAEEAKNFGLINAVISSDKIEEEVSNFIQKICVECSQEALAITKKMIAEVQQKSIEDALQYAAEMNAFARTTADCKKGIASFLTREKLVW